MYMGKTYRRPWELLLISKEKMMPGKPSEFCRVLPTRPLSSKASKYLSSRQYVEELAVCCTKRFMAV